MYGDRPDPVTAATSFVAQWFPDAAAAFVGGGVLTEHRTPTSDLDVVVVLPGPPAPYRETFEHAGWIVEAFVHTRESLDDYWAADAQRRVCSLLRMCTDSVVLTDPGGVAEEISSAAARRMAAGPPPLGDGEWERLRYGLTDLLDDMAGCDDEAELLFIAGAVVRQVATLALELAGQWSARGKALPRALRTVDPDLLERLVSGHRHVVNYGDTAVLHRAAVDVLLRAGGALMVGYRVGGTPGPAGDASGEGRVSRTGPAVGSLAPMTDVLLVTCADLPDGELGGDLLLADLAGRGIAARWVAWDDPAVDWAAAGLVAVRSTWDYEWRREEFLAWAGSVGPALLNGADVFAWNTDKQYLVDLAATSLPVVPTVSVEDESELAPAVAGFFPAVVKPRVGAGGRGVVVFDGEPGGPEGLDESQLGIGPWVVQPLVDSVRTEGETSVFVFGGEVVSQVSKVPGAGEIRVHESYGGRSVPAPVTQEAADVAREAVAVVERLLGGRLDYARVDLMRGEDGALMVSEVEVTEPGLYLDLLPQNAAAFGALVERSLAARTSARG